MARYAFFDADYYLKQNQDVAVAWQGNVEDHYYLFGANEGRAPAAWFNAQEYRQAYQDLQALNAEQLFAHYNSNGYKEGRIPSAGYDGFDTQRYLDTYSDLGAGGITNATALNHYLIHGKSEGRIAYFDDGTQVDAPPVIPVLSVDAPSITEGDAGTKLLTFTLTLDNAPTEDLAVQYETLSTGTATPGDDFQVGAGVVTFAAGQTVKTINVVVIGDTKYEADETVKVKFSGAGIAADVIATGVIINDDVNPAVQPQTLVLTTGLDDFTGANGGRDANDTFLATQATLQLGDRMDGAGGDGDLLDVAISGAGISLQGFTAMNIETIRVKSISDEASTLDLSDTEGVVRLVSDETDGASLTFRDIQNVNATALEIVDTKEDHTFIYDTNAYAPNNGQDIVDLTLSEIRDSNGEEDGQGVDITFLDRDGSSSEVDKVVLHSVVNTEAGPTPAGRNYVQSLNVGSKFADFDIDGNADLEIEESLDDRVKNINAETLNANLTLDVVSQASVGTFSYVGAMQRDNLDVTRDGNNNIDLKTGNDDLTVLGNGNQEIVGGEGNDVVRITAGHDEVNVDDGMHDIDLGNGNDALYIVGDVDDYNTVANLDGITTIEAGSGNDTVDIRGDGDYRIYLGEGHDELIKVGNSHHTIEAGAGNDRITVDGGEGESVNIVNLDEGDDWLSITGNGNQQITGGEGNDTVDFDGDGNVSANLGSGNDSVTIHDNGGMNVGFHDIGLGQGADYLLIDGGRVEESDNDNSIDDNVTFIDAGSENDTVDVRYDHFLNVDLGTGDDRLILRAKDLTTDDLIAGNTGYDTLQLSNASTAEVLRDESDTDSTTSIEQFDLRNQNITLELTADNFDTTDLNADGKHEITVYTREANKTDLPQELVTAGLYQGMTVQEFTNLALTWTGWTDGAAARTYLVNYLLDSGVDVVDFNDQTADGDNILYTEHVESGIPVENEQGTNPEISNVNDKVFFNVEPDGYMAVDITAVPLSLASGREFTLLGGNIKDIVIADDDSINGRSTLEFDGPGGVNQSVEDTLVVDGNDASIEAADLRNVSGLEIIELSSDDQSRPARWEIVLTERVINQTTGSADLVIKVDTEVPAGSKLYIKLDQSVHDGSTNNVRVLTNSNVTVYITDAAHGIFEQEVRTDDFGHDYDLGTYEITVLNQLNFTTDNDNLIGTDGPDTFFAQSVDQMQEADFADGGDGFDTAVFAFGVSNDNRSLAEQLNNATLNDIEKIVFDTGETVRMNGIGFGYAPDLEELVSGRSSDDLWNMRKGLIYDLENGDDELSLLAGAPSTGTTIHGGAGQDSVYGSEFWAGRFGWQSEADHISVTGVEYIDLYGNGFASGFGGDSVDLMQPNPVRVEIWNAETIIGSSGADLVDADTNGSNAWDSTIYIDGREGDDDLDVGFGTPTQVTALGGLGNDSIDVLATDAAYVYGDEAESNNPNVLDGNDSIEVHVSGAAGNDTVSIGGETFNVIGEAEAFGEGGDDEITVVGGLLNGVLTNVAVSAWGDLLGDHDGADTIDVSSGLTAEAFGNGGDDDISAYVFDGAYAYGNGGAGADTIAVEVLGSGDTNDATIGLAIAFGLEGDDSITATLGGDDSYGAWVEGGTGNDTITVANNSDDSTQQYYFVAGDLVASDARFVAGGDLFGDNENSFDANLAYAVGADLVDTDFQFDNVDDSDWFNGSGNEAADVSAAQRHDYGNSDLVTDEGEEEIILGGANQGGDDLIVINAVEGENLYGFIVGGVGNDDIRLAGNEDGTDVLVFGDIGYGQLQDQDFNSQGTDVITGFNFEDALPGDPAVDQRDVLNFDAFLGLGEEVSVRTANWADGNIAPGVLPNIAPVVRPGTEGVYANDANGDNETDISVIVVKDDFVLTDANFSAEAMPAPALDLGPILGQIHIADNGRGVVVLARDNDGSGTNMSNFEVYFVQDIDTTAGPTAQTWQIDHVADITSLTLVGLDTVAQNLGQLYNYGTP